MTNYLNIPSTSSFDTVHVKNYVVSGPSNGLHFRNTTFRSSYTMAFQTMPAGQAHHDMNFTDCFIDGLTRPDGSINVGNNWGAHRIGIMSGRAERVYARAHDEHAWYDEIPGGYEWFDCTAEAGSQAWQIEDREFTSSGARMWPAGYDRSQMRDCRWVRCWARECGQDYARRPAYAWTLYREAGNHVLENCQATRGPNLGGPTTMRALLLRGAAPTLEIHGGNFDYAEPDRALVYLMRGAGAKITRAHFARGVLEIGTEMRDVTIAGCTGNAVIRTPDGKQRPVTQGIVY